MASDYTVGVETKCDMCGGKGTQGVWVHKRTGVPFMSTTAELPEKEWKAEMRWMKRNGKVVQEPCSTCGGTGIMPEYLKPGYWKARVERAEELRRPSVFWPAVARKFLAWFDNL
jgi:hypothetical protein